MRTINPLNYFAPRTIASSPSADPRDNSKDASSLRRDSPKQVKQEDDDAERDDEVSEKTVEPSEEAPTPTAQQDVATEEDEKTPLLAIPSSSKATLTPAKPPIIKRIASAVVGSFTVVVAAVLAPGRWLIACFYDDQGHFSTIMPLRRMIRTVTPRRRARDGKTPTKPVKAAIQSIESMTSAPSYDTAALTSESELDSDAVEQAAVDDSPARNTRSKTPLAGNDQGTPPKRSIRIKAVGQDELRRRKQKRAQDQSKPGDPSEPPLTVATIKSPTGPAASSLKITKYPRAPAPPRPLIPRRQPSYSSIPAPSTTSQKTLVIDLDETLIHSMAKGGRMSTGHMVEVKLSSPVGVGNSIIAPQVPILYYVHKRPHCDEFLKKVSKWYNLIVFTASVQEYADPVIDWLELERKYFSARYYRQHCTYRNGAYIKDLSQVEPDLSKVMILDNSPICYIFHEGDKFLANAETRTR